MAGVPSLKARFYGAFPNINRHFWTPPLISRRSGVFGTPGGSGRGPRSYARREEDRRPRSCSLGAEVGCPGVLHENLASDTKQPFLFSRRNVNNILPSFVSMG